MFPVIRIVDVSATFSFALLLLVVVGGNTAMYYPRRLGYLAALVNLHAAASLSNFHKMFPIASVFPRDTIKLV